MPYITKIQKYRTKFRLKNVYFIQSKYNFQNIYLFSNDDLKIDFKKIQTTMNKYKSIQVHVGYLSWQVDNILAL